MGYIEMSKSGMYASGIDFSSFPNLEVLDFQGSDLMTKQIDFGAMDKLHWINLSENSAINAVKLDGASNLHTVLANNCSFSEFNQSPTGIFLPEGLTVLELKSNNIQRLGVDQFPRSLKWLKVDGNPFVCDCLDVDYQNWLKNEEGLLDDYNFVCSQGKNEGQKIKDVDFGYCDEVVTTTSSDVTSSTQEVTDGPTTDGPSSVEPITSTMTTTESTITESTTSATTTTDSTTNSQKPETTSTGSTEPYTTDSSDLMNFALTMILTLIFIF